MKRKMISLLLPLMLTLSSFSCMADAAPAIAETEKASTASAAESTGETAASSEKANTISSTIYSPARHQRMLRSSAQQTDCV